MRGFIITVVARVTPQRSVIWTEEMKRRQLIIRRTGTRVLEAGNRKSQTWEEAWSAQSALRSEWFMCGG